MKTTTVLLALLLLATAASAQPTRYFSDYRSHQRANIDVIATRMLACLESPNEGVVESALAHIGLMKLYLPDQRFSDLESKIRFLAIDGANQAIRYRAYLVSSIFRDPAAFTADTSQNYNDPDEFFGAIGERLQQSTLGLNQLVQK